MPVFVPKDREESEGFTALPPGFYNITVDSVEPGWGQKSGGAYITWVLVVDDEGFAGSKLWHRTSMSEKAVAHPGDGLYAVLNRLGLDSHFEDRDLEFEKFVDELADVAPGCQAIIAVSQYEYNNQTRNEVDEFWVKDAEGSPQHQIFGPQPAVESVAEDPPEEPPPQESPPPPARPRGVTGGGGASAPKGRRQRPAPTAEPPY